ncbi:hypothetical protein FCM35_KLT17092 [Carex littledalei]|uniref:Uncharacterized protein n=1 Tax=Carex littledalei TaxID=544730 RepID=A0A833QYD0_9POAL|nr:hypothetical protein FCM35_KLT17092 [Carex littledalei]
MFFVVQALEGLDKAARMFEKLVLVWGKAVLLGGFVVTLEMKDFEFIALICLFIFMRISCRSHMPELSKVMHLVSVMTCVCSVVFSTMQLVSQHFGETEETYKATRNLALNAFYVMALTHALVNFVYHALYVVLY